jgi:hypothetical protein
MRAVANQDHILRELSEDARMMKILRRVRDLNLPDWWIAAGFVRNKIWDAVHEKTEPTPLNDVDVIYFDSNEIDEKFEIDWERTLNAQDSSIPWSVKNQARMHLRNGHSPYHSATDAMSRWPETATCVGVRLDPNGGLELAAPLGISDLAGLIVRRNPGFTGSVEDFVKRQNEKQWASHWPELTFVGEN